jgi:hypothetical protein
MAALKTLLLTVLMGFASTATAASVEDAELLRQADQAIQEGVQRSDDLQKARPFFLDAARRYEALHERGIHNPELFRDQGNAHLLAGDLPRAILAYRRGLRLAPRDRVLQTNLTYAREQVDYPSPDGFGRPPLDDWPPWLPRSTLGLLVASLVLAHAAGWLLLTRWLMVRRGWLLLAAGTAFLIMALFVLGAIQEVGRQRKEVIHPLIVVAADGIPLRNGNGMAYPARYEGKTLHRGVEARLLFERDDWLHIELAGGETGWVRRADVLVDAP